jgi:hypothetical protein
MIDISAVTQFSILGVMVLSVTLIGMSVYENTTSREPIERLSDENTGIYQLGGKSRKRRKQKSKTRRLFR